MFSRASIPRGQESCLANQVERGAISQIDLRNLRLKCFEVSKRGNVAEPYFLQGSSVRCSSSVSAAIILATPQSSSVTPRILLVHLYDAALYTPPCPLSTSVLNVNVTVSISGPKSPSGITDTGLIVFQGLPPGSYQVTGIAGGYSQDLENASVTSDGTTHVCLRLPKSP